MPFQEPLSFSPIYQERPWGGRSLEQKLGRTLPSSGAFGESWEFSDRLDAQSRVHSGPHKGANLHTLWTQHREAVFGPHLPDSVRFPMLLKLLDAREPLSVQVHPSGKETGPSLGEPKNEWWYILAAEPDAAVYAGFQSLLSQAEFEAALATGTVEPLLHRIPVKAGDSIYIPGGRCHAIGGGCLIAEVQQNSDTTFRVFDWNRKGPDGLPRALHLEQSLACISFSDVTPSLAPPLGQKRFSCEFFDLQKIFLRERTSLPDAGGGIFLVLSGRVSVGSRTFGLGDWFLLPFQAGALEFSPESPATELLQVRLPQAGRATHEGKLQV